MSLKFDDAAWGYWVRAEYWNDIEAAFILDGIIPSAKTLHEYGLGSDQGFFLEPTTETILNLVRRKFQKGRITPRECLEWANEIGIAFEKELIDEAGKYGISPRKTVSFKEEHDEERPGKGSHYLKMRYGILCKALSILNDRPEGFKLFHKDNRINLTQLQAAIVDLGAKLEWKTGKSVSADTIYQTIQSAIKGVEPDEKGRD